MSLVFFACAGTTPREAMLDYAAACRSGDSERLSAQFFSDDAGFGGCGEADFSDSAYVEDFEIYASAPHVRAIKRETWFIEPELFSTDTPENSLRSLIAALSPGANPQALYSLLSHRLKSVLSETSLKRAMEENSDYFNDLYISLFNLERPFFIFLDQTAILRLQRHELRFAKEGSGWKIIEIF